MITKSSFVSFDSFIQLRVYPSSVIEVPGKCNVGDRCPFIDNKVPVYVNLRHTGLCENRKPDNMVIKN